MSVLPIRLDLALGSVALLCAVESAVSEDFGWCWGDLDGDCIIDGRDLSIVLGAWNTNDINADVNGDGIVNGTDLTLVLGGWGDCMCDYDYSLDFHVETGARVENAANAQAAVADNGMVWLYYKEGEPGEPGTLKRATSFNGYNFGVGVQPTDWLWHAKNIKIPEGFGVEWRRIWWDGGRKVFLTSISDDGALFLPQNDPCYEPRPEDTFDIGIIDCFVTPDGRVVLLYIGDMFGLNNVRRAESTDGGASFSFVDDDVFGDADKGGTTNSFVDQRVVELADGRYRAFVMRDGRIYSFTSNDGGENFDTFDGEVLAPEDVTDYAVRSLHDPSVICMADQSYRMYVTAFIDNDPPGPGGDDYEVIISADTGPPSVP